MRTLIKSLCLSALLVTGARAQTLMPGMDLTAGFFCIDAEVASNQKNRMQGLMHRRAMQANEGMLFVFTQEERHCMWMRNTFLPLSVAFLDANGLILNIEDMEPQTEDNHCAAAPARFALEMNKGWFAGKGIKPGQRIGGVEKSPRPQ